MKKTILALAVAAASTMAMAQSQHDVYVSGSWGMSNFDSLRVTGGEVAKVGHVGRLGLGYKIKGGYAVELGYSDLGEYSYSAGSPMKATAYDLTLVKSYNVAKNVDVNWKLGYAPSEVKLNNTTKSADTAVYGLGAAYSLDKNWSLTADWYRYHDFAALSTKVDTLQFGAKYNF